MGGANRRLFVAVLGVLVAWGLGSPEAGRAQKPDRAAVVGTWSGAMALMGAEFPFTVHLSVAGDSLSGTLDAQGMTDLRLVAVRFDGDTVRFERRGSAGALLFSGAVSADSITGTLAQGAVDGTFRLTRRAATDAVPVGEPPEGAAPTLPQGDGTGRLEACRPPGITADALCGSLRVPEDRNGNGSRSLDLNIVVLPATGPDADSVPLVMLAGGPGGAATQMAPTVGLQFPDVRRRFDVILVDQRGTGRSNPLQCPFHDVNEMARGALMVDFDPGALDACRDALDADLTEYTTPVATDDLADVVHALGYSVVNVYGLSYGTRAALVFTRRHPELVRTLTLQGVAPLSLKLPLHVARDAQASLEGVFRDCSADETCSSAYPDLAEKLTETIDYLEGEPAVAEITDPVTGEPGTLEITPDVFTGGIRSLLYASAFIQGIPRLLDAAYHRDFGPFIRAVLPLIQSFGTTIDFGMYLSVVCTEDLPFIDEGEARALGAGTFLGDRTVRHHKAACRNWPRGTLPEGYSEPVRSALPTLLISGTSDPVTPPHWAEDAARYLPNSVQIVVPNAGHADSVGPCEQGIIAAFMAAGSTAHLDLGCVAEGRTRQYGMG